MMQTKVKLAGFRELDKALSELPKATGRGVLRRIARDALDPMATAAAAKAPEDEGKLAFSIAVSEGRTRRAKTGFNKRDGLQMAMGPASGMSTLQYATFVEFGTVDTPAQPFMRPAWDEGVEKALEHVKDNLGNEIAKAAARVAKRKKKAR